MQRYKLQQIVKSEPQLKLKSLKNRKTTQSDQQSTYTSNLCLACHQLIM
jgi:hypothetical protein